LFKFDDEPALVPIFDRAKLAIAGELESAQLARRIAVGLLPQIRRRLAT